MVITAVVMHPTAMEKPDQAKAFPRSCPGGGAKEEEGVLVSSRGSSLELTLHLELEGVEGG